MNTVHFLNNVYMNGVKMNRFRIRIFLLFVLSMLSTINGQQESVLNAYLKEGLKNNIVLKHKKISYEKARLSLKSATSLFFPSVGIIANYTHGEGGRSIAIPVGDLMNPVYQTLNQLTSSNAFPNISNVEESFFPNKFYDVKIRASMPILNTDIIYNRDIKEREAEIKEFEVELYKKDLVKEIKTAYFTFLSSREAVTIYNSALELAAEAKRVNESLVNNGTGLKVYILRAESEIENLKSKLVEAEANSDAAKKYFNFLINRNLTDEIIIDNSINLEEVSHSEKEFLSFREEIKMLNKAVEINRSLLSMSKSFWIPKLSGFIDLGAQDSNWKYSSKSRYHLYGIQLEIPLFEGFRNINKIEEASLELQERELELEKTVKALSLSASVSANEYNTALQNYYSAVNQYKSAAEYNRLIEKGYKEGINSFIETVDARNQLTAAKQLINVNKYAVLIAKAKYERETSTENINY